MHTESTTVLRVGQGAENEGEQNRNEITTKSLLWSSKEKDA